MRRASEYLGDTGAGPSATDPAPNRPAGSLQPAGAQSGSVDSGRADAPSPAGAVVRPPLVDSAYLLRGHTSIEISHQGVLYRLQATRLGKLILTK